MTFFFQRPPNLKKVSRVYEVVCEITHTHWGRRAYRKLRELVKSKRESLLILS